MVVPIIVWSVERIAHGGPLRLLLRLELVVVVGLGYAESFVEIVIVDGESHGRELLHDVDLLRRIDFVLFGIDELSPPRH